MSEKPRRKRAASYHHGDLRDALMRAARTILEKDGLAELSLRGVARAVGVSPAAPYHHFADKHALLTAVATQGFAALRSEMITRMAKETDPVARLDASGVGYVVFAVDNPALFRLMFGGEELSANAILAEAGNKLMACSRRRSPIHLLKALRTRSSASVYGRSCTGLPNLLSSTASNLPTMA